MPEPAAPRAEASASARQLYPTLPQLDFAAIEAEIGAFWEAEHIFEQSITRRQGAERFTFYEGPPSANGVPGIHHVMARAIKDLFCRYQTLKGKQVHRRAGWDTHGLPIELQVEKQLGITKKDIGVKISIEDYNKACRESVMKFKGEWDALTRRMGYWVDLDHPYITFTNDYIESVWALLKTLYSKGLLYKGFTIQPYSPAAGTGLSSHELNQPGTYKPVKDTSITAMFALNRDAAHEFLWAGAGEREVFCLAWTTTPWTLPANSALVVGEKINYLWVDSFNPYTAQPIRVLLAQARLGGYFNPEGAEAPMEFTLGAKLLPYRIAGEAFGGQLVGLGYTQLMPYVAPTGDAFKIIPGDFVTTEDGTGIVHASATFGADDARVIRQHGLSAILVTDEETGAPVPIVDKQGKYVQQMGEFAGRYVKDYQSAGDAYQSLDVDLAVKLKTEGRAFRIEKYEHNYPHCWRTDKPVLYYPLDAWFIRTTAAKDRMVQLNRTIQWKPESTGTGRFGNWLENLEDWNLSRSRYWGIPLPIWRNAEGTEERCIGSVAELEAAVAEAVAAGLMKENPLARGLPYERTTLPEGISPPQPLSPIERGGIRLATSYSSFGEASPPWPPSAKERGLRGEASPKTNLFGVNSAFDLHRPYIDALILADSQGLPMTREPDLIDVWFDSGAMPFAQWHYPFEHQQEFRQSFPADFIAEGVDQTRGWFFTLHAIAVLTQDSVAYRTVVSNGLVLDKDGNKMSKRLGNAVDPFLTLDKYGADATRWYMVENSNPWENLKFNEQNLQEVQRRFFGTLWNTYQFFALYANIDGWRIEQFNRVPRENLAELDRWVLSRLYSVVRQADEAYTAYEPTRAARAVQEFVVEDLSNWYVRLCRRRFWKGEQGTDKQAAYETLQHCLLAVAQLMSPIAPYLADWLYRALTAHLREESIARNTPFAVPSVHLTNFHPVEEEWIEPALEARMAWAQQVSSLAHGIRKKEKLKVRQPLPVLYASVPSAGPAEVANLALVSELIAAEVNVKEVVVQGREALENPTAAHFSLQVKANFKELGFRFGKDVQAVAKAIQGWNDLPAAGIQEKYNAATAEPDAEGYLPLTVSLPDNSGPHRLKAGETTWTVQALAGYASAAQPGLTVSLDLRLTETLRQEGFARELVNRLQNLRKDHGLDVTDTITVHLAGPATPTQEGIRWQAAVAANQPYICTEILASSLVVGSKELPNAQSLELEGITLYVLLTRNP